VQRCNCGKKAVYFQKHSGQKLCKRCFFDSIEKKVRKTISKHKMFQKDNRIAFALSGGKDSVSLLHILHKIEERFLNTEMIAVTIDEGIVGYREDATAIAKENTNQLDIEHVIGSFHDIFGASLDQIIEKADSQNGKRLAACTFCGVLRRKAINIVSRDLNADIIVTAHNLDDIAQTILINLIRGDVWRLGRDLNSSKMIDSRMIPRVKPAREIPEKEITLYAYFKELNYHGGSCPYSIEALRGDIRNFLSSMEVKRPGTLFTLLKTSEKISKSLQHQSSQPIVLGSCEYCAEPTQRQLCKACELLVNINLLGEKSSL
jgi:uncharacterized protein (TIGR00269 family)